MLGHKGFMLFVQYSLNLNAKPMRGKPQMPPPGLSAYCLTKVRLGGLDRR